MAVDFALAESGYQCDKKDIDETTATELKIWLDNTFHLYRMYYDWVKNYARKMKRGAYTKKLAIKGIAGNLVPLIMRDYKHENGLGKVNKCTKLFLGLEIVDSIEESIKDRSIEYWVKFEIPPLQQRDLAKVMRLYGRKY
jgi:hypothetical protein